MAYALFLLLVRLVAGLVVFAAYPVGVLIAIVAVVVAALVALVF